MLADNLIDVYVVEGDFGNIGPGAIIGVYTEEGPAQKVAKGRGSMDCGGDGHVNKYKGYTEGDRVYLIGEPFELNKVIIPDPRYRFCSLESSSSLPPEEKTEYSVFLVSVPEDKKIEAMRKVRTLADIKLKEVQELVNNLPQLLVEGISHSNAIEVRDIFMNIDCTVDIR